MTAACLANPQRPSKQGKGAIQPKQNKKQQAPNNKSKSSNNALNGQRKIASGKAANANAKTKNPVQPKFANGNQLKKSDAVNKKLGSKVDVFGGAAAVGGGAAVMSMPAIWNDEMPFREGDSNAPPGAVGLAVEPFFPGDMPPFDIGRDYMNNMNFCMMPYAPFLPFPNNAMQGPDFMHAFPRPMIPPMPPSPPTFWSNPTISDEPPTIPADLDPEEAKGKKMFWLVMQVLQNKPYSLDDPRLNLSDEEKKDISGKLSNVSPNDPMFSSLMGGVPLPSPFIGGPFMPLGSPDAQMTIQSLDAASSIGVARLGAVAASAV